MKGSPQLVTSTIDTSQLRPCESLANGFMIALKANHVRSHAEQTTPINATLGPRSMASSVLQILAER